MFRDLRVHFCHGVAISVALLAIGCEKRDDGAAWWRGEQERLELSHQVALKDYRYSQLGSDNLAQLEKLRESNKALTASRLALTTRKMELSKESEALDREFSSFRLATLKDYRQRMIGRKFDKLDSPTSRIYREVTVAAIDDAGVTIRHADGSARLGYEDLDADQRLRFGLEEDLALAAVEKEARRAADYERWIDDRLAFQRERDSKAAEESSKRAELAASRARTLLASSTRFSASTRSLARSSSSFGSGYSSYRSLYRSYRPTYRYVYNTPSSYRSHLPNSCISPSRRITPRVITHRSTSHNTAFTINP